MLWKLRLIQFRSSKTKVDFSHAAEQGEVVSGQQDRPTLPTSITQTLKLEKKSPMSMLASLGNLSVTLHFHQYESLHTWAS